VVTTGVLGRPWRASVTAWGAVEPWPDRADARTLDWYVAADDRWHVPADEATVRQERVDGTPVAETRVRVPRGDVVQTVYSVADAGGLTVIEVLNESTLPVAIAFSHRDVLTERPIVDVPIQGIDLPAGAFVLPLGHQASLRIAISHTGRTGPLPAGLPSAVQVARGWSTIVDRASRAVLPAGEIGAGLAAQVVAERCELALGSIADAADSPVEFAVGLGELVRLGEDPQPWLPELVDAVEVVARERSWSADVALDAAARVLVDAGERRALRDLDRIRAGRTRSPLPPALPAAPPAGVLAVAWHEARFASGPELMRAGFPDEWLGQSIEVYGMPTGDRSSVSYAIRWHGARPAILWEQTGEPVELSAPAVAPGWRTTEATGEALWPEPAAVR
jgi:hypothetical protein